MPRHPPCALKHLQHKKPKEKASPTRGRNLYELKNSEIAHQHTKDTNPRKDQRPLRARCSQPLSTNQTPHPTTKDGATTTTPTKRRTIPGFPHSGRRDSGPVASKPNSVSGNPSPAFPRRLNVCCCTRTPPTTGEVHLTNRPGHRTPTGMWAGQ
jgi:hypothetical protein